MISLYDTAAGRVLPLEPREPGKVSMYVCGPTVYGPPHLGHGRFSLAFDVLRRYLIWSGLDVTYVSNITDIEDKIIQRAEDEGRPWQQITAEYEAVWYDAMDAIGVMRPDHDPHATDYVDQMVGMIADLVGRGSAYVTDDGVYLSVDAVEGYGLLAHQSLDEMLAGGGDRAIVGGDQKRHPADFALWKLAKPGEPAWPSPWGDGRPGWHTECVVMSLDLLGDDFDLHGGGMDLAFPHHENERAQAVALGRPFARTVGAQRLRRAVGEKMSKSLGNFTTLTDLVAEHDPRAYRLLVLQSHYRSPLEVTPATISAAEASLRPPGRPRPTGTGPAESRAGHGCVGCLRGADGRQPGHPGGVRAALRPGDRGEPADRWRGGGAAAPLAAAWSAIMGSTRDCRARRGRSGARRDPRPGTTAQLGQASKDFATADSLREQIVAAGYVAEDSSEGTVVRPA